MRRRRRSRHACVCRLPKDSAAKQSLTGCADSSTPARACKAPERSRTPHPALSPPRGEGMLPTLGIDLVIEDLWEPPIIAFQRNRN